ncbi:MAG: S49 family peptidase [Alphaproteobacteria bacterium]
MMHHAQIAQRAFNTPLMVEPSKVLAFLSGLGPRITGREIRFQGDMVEDGALAQAAPPARASLIGGELAERERDRGTRPFALIDGIAIVEITGTLVHRGAWIGQSSGITSYEGIAAQIDAALADTAVRGIALEIDSFGGEVAGAFDLADRIRAAREQKPVHAFVAEHALSAGYILASQASHITLPRTGAVGSIGVVVLHSEMSGMLDQKGIRVTLVHAGAHKVDANPYEPLPEAIRDRMQLELENLRTLFAQTVAKGRGELLDIEAALKTEAAVFRGVEAVTAGLADAVSDPRSAFRAFAEDRHDPGAITFLHASTRIPQSRTRKEIPMKPNSEPADETASEIPAVQTPAHAQTEAATPPAATPTKPLPQQAEPDTPNAAAPDADVIRAQAAEVAQICAQAARLGVSIDTADAVKRGLEPGALRAQVLNSLAATSDAALIVATTPAAESAKDSPLVAAAKKAAAEART